MESNSIANLLGAILGGDAAAVPMVPGKSGGENADAGVSFADLLEDLEGVASGRGAPGAFAAATKPGRSAAADGDPSEGGGETKAAPARATASGPAADDEATDQVRMDVTTIDAAGVGADVVGAAPIGPEEPAETVKSGAIATEGTTADAATPDAPEIAPERAIEAPERGGRFGREGVAEGPKPSSPVPVPPKPTRIAAAPAPVVPTAKAPVVSTNPAAGPTGESAPPADPAAEPAPTSTSSSSAGDIEAMPLPGPRVRPVTNRPAAAVRVEGESASPPALDEVHAPAGETSANETAAPSPPDARPAERAAGFPRSDRPSEGKPAPVAPSDFSPPERAATAGADAPQPAVTLGASAPKPVETPEASSPESIEAPKPAVSAAPSPEPRVAEPALDPAPAKKRGETPTGSDRALPPEKPVAAEGKGDTEPRESVNAAGAAATAAPTKRVPETKTRTAPAATTPMSAPRAESAPAGPGPDPLRATRVNDAPPVHSLPESAASETPAAAGGDPDLPVPGLPEATIVDEIRIDELRVRSFRSLGARSGHEGGEETKKGSPARESEVRHIFRSPLAGDPVLPARIEQLRSAVRILGDAPEPSAADAATAPPPKDRFTGTGEPVPAEEIASVNESEKADDSFAAPVAEPTRATHRQTAGTHPAVMRAAAPTEGTAARPAPAPQAPSAPTLSTDAGLDAPFAQARVAAPGPSSTPAAAALPFREEILAQVAEGMRTTLRRGKSEAEIRLDPPELGHLKLRITVSDTSLHGFIKVENPAVKAMLEADLPRLHSALAESGLDLTQFDVLLEDDRRPGSGRRQDGETPAFGGRIVEDEIAEPVSSATAAPGGAGRVNYLF